VVGLTVGRACPSARWDFQGTATEEPTPALEALIMMPFATPDFGASAGIGCFVVLAWAFVLLLVGVGVVWGLKLLDGGSPKGRRRGVLLLVVSGLVPLSCCLGPSQVVRLVYGNYPLGHYPNNKVQEGMTAEEVVAVLGPPHERWKKGDGETWCYWIDSFGAYWFAVDFGEDGRVASTYGN
jgi:hypothetical protein